ncbi:MAG: glycosyltransferase family 2 protein [Lachnospiraceae bacterium]|nr:glycosyltransferase family 2 protein [Lachnospiraceae bacterium]
METMVSVIIPTYNRADMIKRAIDSVLRQTYRSYEVIVVDDGSADDTGSVIADIQDARIRYIALMENQGVAHARNVGIREARYDYIAFLDSDDEWMPDKLELQMRMFRNSSEEIGMVYCRTGGRTRDGMSRFVCPARDFSRELLEGDMFRFLLQQNVIGTPAVIVRRDCLEQVGGFKETLQCLEDWEWILRVAGNWKIGFVDQVLVEVHKSSGSVSTNMSWHLIVRCYLVSLYRREMTEAGILNDVQNEILDVAGKTGIYDEVSELLKREIEL